MRLDGVDVALVAGGHAVGLTERAQNRHLGHTELEQVGVEAAAVDDLTPRRLVDVRRGHEVLAEQGLNELLRHERSRPSSR